MTAARILHTSDWHLGGHVRGEPRAADHDEVIDEICGIAADFAPDLILHTGDLFDGTRPGHDDLLRGLRAIRRLADVAPVVVLAGNHDAPSCFELLAEAVGAPPPAKGWDPQAVCRDRIRFLPRPATADRGAVATYETAAGPLLRLACLPFVHANRVITGMEDIADLNATYADKVRKIVASISERVFAGFDPATMVAVWASHLHVHDAKLSSEKNIHVAESYATDPAHFDPGYSYLAFGHIHRPQDLPGGRGRYAGSPLEIDFGEEGERKTVVQITAEPASRAVIRPVELASGRRLRRVRGSLADIRAMAGAIGRDLCVVTVDDGAEDVDSLNRAVRDALPGACILQVIDGRQPAAVALDDLLDDPETQAEESIGTAYRRWLTEGEGDPHVPGADLTRVVELFDELLAAVDSAAEPDPVEGAELERLETAALTAGGPSTPTSGEA